jgi:hypothetical protein
MTIDMARLTQLEQMRTTPGKSAAVVARARFAARVGQFGWLGKRRTLGAIWR